jgi:type I restriction-modification system DNA methylase subunit/DNA repair exonuclease SbcCD ATPase subunit
VIRRLELHNFATHDDTEIEFENNKNIIIGQTGSGKTNLLQAIDFAFLGSEQGINLEELVADGAESTEVILDYLDPRTNQNYRIHRTLTRKAEGGADHVCSITNLETNETVRKPDPVRKTLEALGVDASVFRYVVHVPQGKFADVLQEGQDRKAVLDRLFKIAQLEETYHELGTQEGPIRKIQDRKEANQLEKATLEADGSKLEQEHALYQKLTEDRQTKQQKVDDARKQYEQLKAIAPSIQTRLDKLDSLDSKVSDAKAIVQTSQSSIQNLIPQLQSLLPDDEIATIETLDAPHTREYLSKLEEALPNFTVERDALEAGHTESVRKAATAKSRHDTVVDEKSSIEKQLQDVSSYLDGKGQQPEIQCDKCGSLLTPDKWVKHVNEIKEKLEETEKKIRQAKELWSNEIMAGEKIGEKLDKAKAHFENHEKAIGFVSQVVTQRENREGAQATLAQLNQERKEIVAELRTLLRYEGMTDGEIVQKARMVPALLEAMPEQITDSERELASYDTDILAPQLKRVEAATVAKKRAKEELQPKIALDTKKIELLQTIRTAFREIQPAVRRGFVARITASANDYLKRLYGGAEIENLEFSEDYEFLVTRAGHKRHAYRLSGGQQVLASMEVSIHLYGQESQPETYAIAKADLLLKGEGAEAENVKNHSTLSADGFPVREFDFMLSNPPYGKSWKTDLERMGGKEGIKDARFIVTHADDPEYSLVTRSSDGQLLFLVNLISKMKHSSRQGSRIAEVHNGSSLFTGDAGQGESNIRRWIIENDLLEAIIALPLNMFYNTGIATYVWVLSNRKSEHRRGKIQLIDATSWFKPLRKNLGKKNCEFSDDDRRRIVEAFLNFKETDHSKIFSNQTFGYWKVTVHRPLRLRGVDPDIAHSPNEIKAAQAKGQRDDTAPPVIKKIHKPGKVQPDPLHGLFERNLRGERCVVEYEPDTDLQDTEQISFIEPGGIESFFRREVLPHVADAWIDESTIKIGYEIGFTRYFYQPQPLRPLEEIRAEILAIEKETEGVLSEIVGRRTPE